MAAVPAGPPPSPSGRVVAEFQQAVGEANVLTAPEDIIPYGFDGTAALKQRPFAVVLPASTSEVAACVKICDRHDLPVHARGSGTGLSGGSVPSAGGVVVVLTRMDRVLELDPANLTITVESGLVTDEINRAVAPHGLFYPPDPSSLRVSTIGGNVAENSGGLRGLKYGVTRNYVMGIKVVTAQGDIAEFGNACVKDVAGYSMKDLFIGSEGTLGIITEIRLRLLPRPVARQTLLATFATMTRAAETVSAIIAAKIIPCTLEFLDQTTIRCVEDYTHVGLPMDCAALLLMETDGSPETVATEAQQMEAIAREYGATSVRIAADENEANELAKARRSAFAALARIRPTTILEDVTVPRSELTTLVEFIAATAMRHRLQVGTFGHMGDGNLHPTFLTDERDAEEMKRVHQALDEIVGETLRLGGTITGEHGVGLAKKPWLRQQVGDASYELMRQIKKTLDPRGRLNPGKIFD